MATNGARSCLGSEDLVTLNRAATVARLVSGVFHELNNSLQVIGGLAELLQDAPGVPSTVADGLRRIHGQHAKAASAIAEVMMFARQKADVRGRVNMRDLASRSVGLRSFAIGRARLVDCLRSADERPRGRARPRAVFCSRPS